MTRRPSLPRTGLQIPRCREVVLRPTVPEMAHPVLFRTGGPIAPAQPHAEAQL